MILLALIALLAAHEAGHALCARAHGLTVALVFRRRPLRVAIAARPTSRAQSRSIACAGPLASILVGLALVAAGRPLLGWFSIVALGVAQLAPSRYADGAHILRRKDAR